MAHRHLVNDMPNFRGVRWLVKKANQRMRKCNSEYRITIKYRKPRKGKKWGWGGSLTQADARKFAIYLNKTANARQNEWAGRKTRDARTEASALLTFYNDLATRGAVQPNAQVHEFLQEQARVSYMDFNWEYLRQHLDKAYGEE